MTEKQASSEIAQSREHDMRLWRLSACGAHGTRERGEADGIWDASCLQCLFIHKGVERGYKAAERDTRERCARIARDIAKEVGGNFAETHRLNVGLNIFIKELERIRGKE